MLSCLTSAKNQGVEGIDTEERRERDASPPLQRDFTLQQLKDFTGMDGNPIYIALRKEVYDVSSAANFYGPKCAYSCFAGREASRAMAKLSFEDSDMDRMDLDDLNAFEKSNLDDWVDKFKHYRDYPLVGKVSIPPSNLEFTRSELLKCRNEARNADPDRVDSPIYVSINRNVYDVSYGGKEMYAEGGAYFLFAGKDISRALAKMSFKDEDVDNIDVSDLTPAEMKVLSDWENKFSAVRKYPCVGRLIED